MPPLLTFGSWMGGDRDGNPNVTAAVTAEALDMMRTACLRLLEARIELLAQRVSLSDRLVGALARARRRALAALGARCSRSVAARLERRNPEEPYRRSSRCSPRACARRARTTRGRLRRAARAARRPAARAALAARRASGQFVAADPAARHDPPGRGVRLPLRPARRPRARRPPRRGDRRDPLGARRARGLRVARAGASASRCSRARSPSGGR